MTDTELRDRVTRMETTLADMKPKVDQIYEWMLKRQGANGVIKEAASPLIPRVWDLIIAGLMALMAVGYFVK